LLSISTCGAATRVEMGEVPGLVEAEVLKDITQVFNARRGAKIKMGESGGFEDMLRERKARNIAQKTAPAS
jgi:hypothetical protein